MPDRNKRNETILKKEKTNQYINETELKSLMIRINNKSFLDFLSNSFLRLDKYIKKYRETDNKEFQEILKKYILRLLTSILKNEKNQLLLIPDKKMKVLLLRFQSGDLEKSLKRFQYVLDLANERNRVLLNRSLKTSDETRLKKYVQKHIKSKSQRHRRILRDSIVQISDRNIIDKEGYERFGEMVLLIIKNILKKPKFSGYSYRDEFYSDSTDKIFRYLKNFNHKMISKITGQYVNAFSYLSQYVHNSVVHIIKTKNVEKDELESYVNMYNENLTLIFNSSSYIPEEKEFEFELKKIEKSLYLDILESSVEFTKYDSVKVQYPQDYKISIEEYNKLKNIKEIVGTKISVIRKR